MHDMLRHPPTEVECEPVCQPTPLSVQVAATILQQQQLRALERIEKLLAWQNEFVTRNIGR
jgi:hypothetical protein